jgi:hypothetical protein
LTLRRLCNLVYFWLSQNIRSPEQQMILDSELTMPVPGQAPDPVSELEEWRKSAAAMGG